MTTMEDRVAAALAQPITAEQRAALDARVRAAIDARPASRRRRLRIGRSLVLVALLMVGLPSLFVVGAAILSTESPAGLADAREFAAELEAAKSVVPIPEGRAWPSFLRPEDPSASYSRGGGRSWVESVAMCLWFDEWLDARAASAVARERVAARTIAEIPSWAAWDGPFFDQSYRDHFGSVIASVGRTDEGPVRAEMRLNCSWVATE
jgi:hypothetical protein